MTSAPALRRTERYHEPIEFESSATWRQVSPPTAPGPSGSVDSRQLDSRITIRRNRVRRLLSDEPALGEPGVAVYVVLPVAPLSSSAVRSTGHALAQFWCLPTESREYHSSRFEWKSADEFGPPRLMAAELCINPILAHGTTGHHAEPSVTDEALFRALAALWRRETFNISSTSRMVMHPAYQRVIGMGSVAVPLILRELQERPDWWFWALQAITGVDPVPPGWRGSLREMAAAWLDWGRRHGYLAR